MAGRRLQSVFFQAKSFSRRAQLGLLQGHHSRKNASWLVSTRPKFQNKVMTWSVRHIKVTKVPNMGDSISEGTLVEWTKKVGDYCKVDDVVAVIETDKVSIDVRTDVAGVITEHLAAVDDTLEVGAPLFKIDPAAKAPEGQAAQPSASGAKSKDQAPAAATASSGSGDKKGGVATAKSESKPEPKAESKPDAKAAPAKPSPSSSSSSSLSSGGKSREERRESMSRMRQRIAQRLKESQTRAASLTTFNEIDMSALTAMRAKHKDIFLEKHGVKLGFMSAFVKASVSALREQPSINAYFDDERKEIVYHDYCDVSVAVASPTGLVVPIQEYANKAKKNTLSLEEMSGGTFTISNGGVFGSLMGTPILNPPQSAILGMHGVFERPVAIDGKVEIRPMMFVALTYDHRIVDGREAVLFLRRVKDTIEDPHRLLLDCDYQSLYFCLFFCPFCCFVALLTKNIKSSCASLRKNNSPFGSSNYSLLKLIFNWIGLSFCLTNTYVFDFAISNKQLWSCNKNLIKKRK
ncbi:succinyltransferase [Reticulomyxa filosa]|uniref:dihydrolipoyllysine-residue succinyltransferase n=1 Tax=Reticulomyxa filosa TaxID=46433 RepID=X6M1E7_RETFI|nr:succinyltransferase [Reticulomyxa filosa]|eukprot:ETO07406.1 succinyltransferase [Reticulomyxa filosa]